MRAQSAYFAAARPSEQETFKGLPRLAQVGASLNGRGLTATVVWSAGLGGEDSSPSAAQLCDLLARHQAEAFPAILIESGCRGRLPRLLQKIWIEFHDGKGADSA